MDQTRTAQGILLGIATAMMLGGSVPVTGLLDDYPFLPGQALRYAVAGAVLLLWCRQRGITTPKPSATDLWQLALVAILGMLGFTACVLLAQRYADPGLVAAVVGGSPLLLASVVPLLEGRRARPRVLSGAVIVVAGVALVAGVGGASGPLGVVLCLCALGCEASFTLCAVGLLRRHGAVVTATYSCFTAAALAVLAGVATGRLAPRLPTSDELLALLVTSLVVTAIAFLCWYQSVVILGGDRAGLLVGLVPVSGLILSVAMGAQPLTTVAVVGALMVAAGTVAGLAPAATNQQALSELPEVSSRLTINGCNSDSREVG